MILKRKSFYIPLLIIGPLLCIMFSLFLGRYPLKIEDILGVLWHGLTGGGSEPETVHQTIVWTIRLPRAILGSLVGASLAVSGTALQGLFRNPLVSSGMLGVSSGAGFGAALAIILFNFMPAIYFSSFGFGILAVLLAYMIGKIYNTTPAIMLVLGGVIVSSVFAALLSFAKYIADPYEDLPSIVFWLMGSLASANYRDILISAVPMLTGMTGIFLVRWRINVLSMGDREARTLGIDTRKNRLLVIASATLATAGAVCVAGIIGWVGLVIPHIGRIVAGNDNRKLVPVTISLGACFLVLIDNLGRIITGGEIPLSILTALVGGPFFVYLLKKTKGGNWQ